MRIENVKWWQWPVIGAIAGLLLWQMTQRMPTSAPSAIGSLNAKGSWLSPVQFARMVERPSGGPNPQLRAITVYPPDNDGQLITGEFLPERFVIGRPIYQRFITSVPMPFKLPPIPPEPPAQASGPFAAL